MERWFYFQGIRGKKHSKRITLGFYNVIFITKKEHIFGKKLYGTKAQFRDNDQNHNLSIECNTIDANNPFLTIHIDSKMVMQVKHLQWKFRGNQTILINRLLVDVFWNVHNWLFGLTIGNAIFIFQTCSSTKKLFDFLLSFLIFCNNESHDLSYLFMYVNCILCSKMLKQDGLSMTRNGTNLNYQRMTFLLIMLIQLDIMIYVVRHFDICGWTF